MVQLYTRTHTHSHTVDLEKEDTTKKGSWWPTGLKFKAATITATKKQSLAAISAQREVCAEPPA